MYGGCQTLRGVLAEVFSKLHFPACLSLLIGGNSSRQRGIRGPTPFHKQRPRALATPSSPCLLGRRVEEERMEEWRWTRRWRRVE